MSSAGITEMIQKAESNDAFRAELASDPVAALEKANAAYTSDREFYRIVVIGLLVIIVLIVSLAGYLATLDVPQGQEPKEIPDWISAIATVAVGGLVGLFATPPGKS